MLSKCLQPTLQFKDFDLDSVRKTNAETQFSEVGHI